MSEDKTILGRAIKLIYEDRESEYGNPRETYGKVAAAFSVITGININEVDAALFMVLLKLVRLKHSNYSHEDSMVDAAGYIGLMERIRNGS